MTANKNTFTFAHDLTKAEIEVLKSIGFGAARHNVREWVKDSVWSIVETATAQKGDVRSDAKEDLS